MYDDFLKFTNPGKTLSKNVKINLPILDITLRFEGVNEDIVSSYYWHIQFPYYVMKGYTTLKLEDHHYFSEASQFGQNQRQIKGGSIRAFQENLQQLVQLIKTHMIPLLKEMKQAEFYQKWFDQIVNNDKIVQELKSKGVSNDEVRIKKARAERNEAINHMKDKWVTEIDGGKLWQMNRPATEQGLDYALLPNLFFGISLDNPLYHMSNTGKTLKEQLDEDVYPVDISLIAKEQVARFMYRFYTWLPSAIRETDMTFRLKISTLKQFYAQLQMYISFMKPLLMEISKKTEGFEKENFFRNFEAENPEVINLFDYSYSFIKIIGVRGFAKKDRGKNDLTDLEFTPYGLYINVADEIISGAHKGKKGFLREEKIEGGITRYGFIKSDKKELSKAEFNDLFSKWKENPIYVRKENLRVFPIMMMDFVQRRMNEITNGPQGAQMIPFMRNDIIYKAYVWNIYEVATYRLQLKQDNLDLLETFVGEIAQIKEDLLYYINYQEGDNLEFSSYTNNKSDSKSNTPKHHDKHDEKSDYSFFVGPFAGIGELFSPLIPNFSLKFSQKNHADSIDKERENKYQLAKLMVVEDTWKLYTIHKKTKGLTQY